jgi:hypothetical protein
VVLVVSADAPAIPKQASRACGIGRVLVVQGGGEAGYLQCSCFPRKVWKPPRSVWCGLSSSAFIVDRDCVAVGVLKRERPAEGAIDGLREDRHVVLGELVMKGLGVVGP